MDILFLIGIAIILGFIGGKLGNRLKFPQVVGYIIIGLFLGPSVFKLFGLNLLGRVGVISDFVLGLVAFVIGSQLPLSTLRKLGRSIVIIIISESFFAFFIVAGGIYLLTHKVHYALIFGAMAPASAPAGTVAVLHEYKAKGPLTNAVLAVVGFDDGLAIIIYAFAVAVARSLISDGESLSFHRAVGNPLMEIGLALASGFMLGLVSVYFMRRIRTRGELLTLTIGSIMLLTGLANLFGFSLILTNLVLGMTLVSLSPRVGRRTLEVVEGVTPPAYVIFFVLAGAHLQLALLPQIGLLGLVYMFGRTSGLMSGSFLGASLAKAQPVIRKYLGLGILSQAGVAIGLAILVGREFNTLGQAGHDLAVLTINTIAATTIIFEIIGPITTKFAITRAGESGE
ncbi:MAG TPA: cation:proton antiporter [Candidatus Latescibacteria bacterium]|nr:cation:proton antiporter [Candidatus Latescibacterota bacterium]